MLSWKTIIQCRFSHQRIEIPCYNILSFLWNLVRSLNQVQYGRSNIVGMEFIQSLTKRQLIIKLAMAWVGKTRADELHVYKR